jgi:N6-L-threonylcarbamoyladenine synthase
MRTLGIETSCDETAVAILDGDGSVECSILASQVRAHAPYGGVVPELASREHLKALPMLVERALADAGGPLEAVAVTAGPGLVGALLVGVRFAAAFAWARRLPLIDVDHLHGHQVSPFVTLDGAPARPIPEPTLGLVASGGHSAWYLYRERAFERLGRTRDDAAGEGFDKVAQVLGLSYPGGPVMDRLARRGDPRAVTMPRPRLKDAPWDFSFSGLKSAAIRAVRSAGLEGVGEAAADRRVWDLAAAYEAAVVDQLLAPMVDMVATHRPVLITVSGGVAANTALRRAIVERGQRLGVEVVVPDRALTTDNAVMIARAGQLRFAVDGAADPRRIDARSREVWHPPGMMRQMARSTATPGGTR